MTSTRATMTTTPIGDAVVQKRVQKRRSRNNFSISVCCSAGVDTICDACAACAAVFVADVAVALAGVGCVAKAAGNVVATGAPAVPTGPGVAVTKGRTAVPGVDNDVIVGIDAAISVVSFGNGEKCAGVGGMLRPAASTAARKASASLGRSSGFLASSDATSCSISGGTS